MTFVPKNFTVWAEIPTRNLKQAMEFYSKVFNLDLSIDESMGPDPIAMFPMAGPESTSGHIYPGKPAGDGSGPTVHFTAPDSLEKTLERVKEAGGQVLSDPIKIPAGRFAYCTDLDGNSIGVFHP